MKTICLIILTCGLSVAGAEPWKRHAVDDTSRGADGVRLTDLNGDGLQDITVGWEEGGLTRVYLHPGHEACKKPWPSVTLGKTPSVEDAVFADLNRDGVEDVVSSCEGGTQRLFVHWAPKDRTKLLRADAWTQEVLPASVKVTRWMFAAPVQLDGEHGLDLAAASKDPNGVVGWYQWPASGELDEVTWHPVTKAGWIMSLIVADMDHDGDPDFLISDRKGPARAARWLENPGPGPKQTQTWASHVIGAAGTEVMFLKNVDFDQDGLDDVVLITRDTKLWIFKRLDRTGKAWKTFTYAPPKGMGAGKAVGVGDLDGDKKNDLVVVTASANPPIVGLKWRHLRGSLDEPDWEDHDISGPEGIKFDRVELFDIDGDGDLDVLTCEERHAKRGLGVIWYENPGEGANHD